MNKQLLGVFSPGSTHWVGDGFHVQNFFPSNQIGELVTPFLLMDYAGPTEFPPSEHQHGVDRHPHAGFETVTLALQGEVAHGDTAGNHGVIGPGDVQWMTAGSGVVHEEHQSEEFAKSGGILEMVQLWVNLRAVDKRVAPRYQTILKTTIPTERIGDSLFQVISGSLGNSTGPAMTYSPVVLIDSKLKKGDEIKLEWQDGHTAAILLRTGSIAIDGELVMAPKLVAFSREGDSISFSVLEESDALFLGGEPIDEPTYFQGPFVMDSPEALRAVIDDYRAGKMG